MTDNEIVKALEICSTYKAKCTDCPAFVKVDRSNCKKVLSGAIDLINRQNAEIERWKKNCDELYDQMSERQKAEVKIARRMGKAEAIKEFAERLHKEINDYRDKKEMPMLPYTGYALDYVDRKIDNLVKEMVGDDNG